MTIENVNFMHIKKANTMNSFARQSIYGFLAALGIFTTWYHNFAFFETSTDVSYQAFISAASGAQSWYDFFHGVTTNPAGMSVMANITIVALVFIIWSYTEAKRLHMRFWLIYPIFTLLVSFAFAFPLFLMMRELYLSHDE